jgi:hypothetical protein
MIRDIDLQTFSQFFKTVTEGPMPEIMNQRGSNRMLNLHSLVAVSEPFNDPHQLAGGMKNSKAMRKSRMRCTRINQI